MFRDNNVIAGLLLFCLVSICFALPVEQIKDFQHLIAAGFAVIAAFIAYSGNINSVERKAEIDQNARHRLKKERMHKLFFFMLSQGAIYKITTHGWYNKSKALQVVETQKINKAIDKLAEIYPLPEAFRENYSSYFVLSEKAVRCLALATFWASRLKNELERHRNMAAAHHYTQLQKLMKLVKYLDEALTSLLKELIEILENDGETFTIGSDIFDRDIDTP